MIVCKIGLSRCPRTHHGPKNTLKWPQEGQNWRQCISCGPTNWFWAKKTKFESVRSKVCSSHPESAKVEREQVLDDLFGWRIEQKKVRTVFYHFDQFAPVFKIYLIKADSG